MCLCFQKFVKMCLSLLALVCWEIIFAGIKGDLMGRKRNETEKTMFMTNLVMSVDVYSKSTLMTLLFNTIVDKETT